MTRSSIPLSIQTEAQLERAKTLIESGRLNPEQKAALQKEAIIFMRSGGAGERTSETARRIAEQATPAPLPEDANLAREEAKTRFQTGGQGFVERLRQFGDVLARPFRSDAEIAIARQKELERTATQQLSAQQRAAALGLPPDAFDATRTVGGIGPDVLAGGAAGAARGITARILGEGVVGAFGGAADAANEDLSTLLVNTALWGATGAGLGLILEVPGISKTLLAGDVRRAVEARYGKIRPGDPFQMDDIARAIRIDTTAGEATADELLKRVEGSIPLRAEGPKEKFVRTRQRQALKQFTSLAAIFNPKNLSTKQVIAQTKTAYESAVKELKKAASTEFQNDLLPAIEATGARLADDGTIIGGDRIIPASNLREALENQLQRLEDTPVVGGQNQAKWLQKQIDMLDDNDGALSLGDAQFILSELTDRATGSGAIVNDTLSAKARIDSKLTLNAVLRDIEDAAEGGAGQLGQEAAEALRKARLHYAQNLQPIKELQGIAADRLLGVQKIASPREFTEKFLELEPTEKKLIFNMLNESSPELANALRGRLWTEILERNTKRSSASTINDTVPTIDLESLAESLSDRDLVDLQILWDDSTLSLADAERVRAGIAQLERLKDTGTAELSGGSRGVDVVSRFRERAINAVSQSPEFMARLLAGEVSPHALERWLFTRDGLQALLAIGQSQPKRGAIAAGMNSLMRLSLDADAEAEELRAEAERAQRMERIGNSGAF